MIRKIGRPCFADKTVFDQTVGGALPIQLQWWRRREV
jgi:hypothetical protein